jgi:hypothetical protein
VVITGGTIDGTTIGATTSSTGRFSTVTATTGNITTINATTLNAATHRSDGNLTFQSNGTTTAMTIDTSQNVGIGTASPTQKLTVSGSASASNYYLGVAAGTYGVASDTSIEMYGSASSQTMLFKVNGNSERMRIDASGNVGIGTSAPAASLSVVKQTTALSGTGNSYGLYMYPTSSGLAYIDAVTAASGNTSLGFRTYNNGTYNDAVRIDNSGNVGIGTTGPGSKLTSYQTAVNNNIESSSPSTGMTHLLVSAGISTAGGADALGVYDNGGISARITTNGYYQSRPNSYGSTSDERLKENIVDATPKLADVMQVRVRNYNYKDQPGDKQLGVIAQELEEIFPGLVHEIPNANPELSGTDTVKSVKYSVFVPMLIKAIQELKAQNDELKARVAALEAK